MGSEHLSKVINFDNEWKETAEEWRNERYTKTTKSQREEKENALI